LPLCETGDPSLTESGTEPTPSPEGEGVSHGAEVHSPGVHRLQVDEKWHLSFTCPPPGFT
jgi:hypothetical protein